MRLLLFSDLHRDQQAAKRLVEMSHAAGAVIGAGDFATMRQGIADVVDILTAIERPTVLVPGNGESFEELVAACASWPSAEVLHGSGTVVEGLPVWGVGGATPPTPFSGDWSYDFTEDEARDLLAGCPDRAVLVSHSPPRGAVDKSSQGESLGSVALLESIEACRPRLVVCGHIHDSAGSSATIGDTTVVNAGPGGVMWELSD